MTPIYGQELVNQLRHISDRTSKRLWIAVPYLGGMESVRRILGERWLEDTNVSVRLLTDVNEFTRFSAETVRQFDSIGEIKHLIGLHAKLYIIDDSCLITSANLTNTAFSKRYELGVFLHGKAASEAISLFEMWWKRADCVPKKALNKFRTQEIFSTEERDDSKRLPLRWNLPDDLGGVNYWLKPIGVTGDPITEDKIFDRIDQKLQFSKQKPSGVRVGDILIAYGIGARRILSVYRVASAPEFDETNKRWPWYIMGKNLTPHFGRDWARHSVFAEEVRKQYLRANVKKSITKVGGISFGGLNLGKDKLKLDPEFARYIIRMIRRLDNR